MTIDEEIADIIQKLEDDIDNRYYGRECLSENHHFEMWDRMIKLKKKRLVLD